MIAALLAAVLLAPDPRVVAIQALIKTQADDILDSGKTTSEWQAAVRPDARFVVSEAGKSALELPLFYAALSESYGLNPGSDRCCRNTSGKMKDLKIALSADGRSAWVTFVLKWKAEETEGGRENTYTTNEGPLRFSELVVEQDGKWAIAAGAVGGVTPDAEANREAAAGKLKAPDPLVETESGPAELAQALRNDTLAFSDRKDAAAFGSAGEKMTAARLSKSWKTWSKSVTVTGPTAGGLAPSGTTGWLAANLSVAKKGYAIPFRIWLVFDKVPAGWRVVTVVLTVATS